MTKPHSGFNLPAPAGQTKTMFYNEGSPTAVLVMNRAGRRKATSMNFPQAEAALAWCRANGAMLIYCPVALERN